MGDNPRTRFIGCENSSKNNFGVSTLLQKQGLVPTGETNYGVLNPPKMYSVGPFTKNIEQHDENHFQCFLEPTGSGFIIKNTTGNSWVEEICVEGKESGKGHRASCPFQTHHDPQPPLACAHSA